MTPKNFSETTDKVTTLLKDSTEYVGMSQSGRSVAIKTSDLMTKANVGLGDADNTSDADKPISDATLAELSGHNARITQNASDIADEQNRAELAEQTNADAIQAETIRAEAEEALKVNTADIYDGLDSTDTNKPLSAKQGNELNIKITSLMSDVYGFQINEITGDYTRTDSAVGMSFGDKDGVGAISSDFDNVYVFGGMRHVKISADGEQVEESNSNYDSFDGNIFTIIPAHYEYDETVASVRTIKVSGSYFQGSTFVPEQTIGSMQASLTGSEVRSRVGEIPKTNKSYTSFLTDIYAQGDGLHSMYNAQSLHTLFLLTTIEAGTPDCQSAYGVGISSSMPYSSSSDYEVVVASTNANTVTLSSVSQNFYVGMDVQIGTAYTNNSIASDRKITDITDYGTYLTITVDGDSFSTSVGNAITTWGQSVSQDIFDAMGNGSGYILENESESRSHVCYRGIWDLWGNCWQFNAGDMRYDGVHYVCEDKTKYNVSSPVGADGWTNTEFGEYAENGWQQSRKAIKLNDSFFDVPVLWGNVANSSTYYSACLYNFNSAYSGARVLRVGGFWASGSYCSLVCSFGRYAPSDSSFSISSRLIR